MGKTLTKNDFDLLLSELGKKYTIYAPARFEKQGRFSDTDLVRYSQVNNLDEIIWQQKSTYSPKEIVMPITQTLFYFTEEQYREPEFIPRPVLVFLRACDINGFNSLDTIYLKNGQNQDIYYKRLREQVKFVLIECQQSFENCFCVSMGANTTDNYSMAVRFGTGNIEVEIKDPELEDYFQGKYIDNNFTPEFVTENEVKVKVPEVDTMPEWIYNDPFWEQYKHRCIACGRCNTTCVTCSCYTATDIMYDDNSSAGERRRVWASCHIDGFTDMAGGHSFRKDNGSRMRFKVFHKIYDFNKRFGIHMCVGCGRCDDNCPEYISYSNCINMLNDRLAEGEKPNV